MLASAAFAPAHAEVLALTGGTVHPVSGPEIANGTILVDGNKITAVGSGIAVPAGATVVDCKGKHVYPASCTRTPCSGSPRSPPSRARTTRRSPGP
jgi:adenine deaminase